MNGYDHNPFGPAVTSCYYGRTECEEVTCADCIRDEKLADALVEEEWDAKYEAGVL